MGVILEPFDDPLFVFPLVSGAQSGINGSNFPTHFEFVEGREVGNAMRHRPTSSIPQVQLGYAYANAGLLSSPFFSAQIAFRWDPSESGSSVIDGQSLDFLRWGPLSLRLAPLLSDSAKLATTSSFRLSGQVAQNVELSSFSQVFEANTPLIRGNWYVLRVSGLVDDTNGFLQVRVSRAFGGSQVINITINSIDSVGGFNSNFVSAMIVTTGPGMTVDDLKLSVVEADQGIDPVHAVLEDAPTSAGDASQWVRSNPSIENYEHVDEQGANQTQPDPDTLTGQSVGTKDLYEFPPLGAIVPAGADILRVGLAARASGSSSRVLGTKHRNGADVESLLSPFSVAVNGAPLFWASATDPADDAPWSKARVDDAQVGVEIVG